MPRPPFFRAIFCILKWLKKSEATYIFNTLNRKTMGLIREPKNVEFTVNSKPWTELELQDFREIMNKLKAKSRKRTIKKKSKTTA
jgi:hypothetical protein